MINITSIYCKSLQSSCVQQVGCVSQDMRLSENRVPLDPLFIIIIPIKIIHLEGIPIFSETQISDQVGYRLILKSQVTPMIPMIFFYSSMISQVITTCVAASSIFRGPGMPGAGVQKVQSQCAQRRGAKLIQPW